jgi:hypothetical protein
VVTLLQYTTIKRYKRNGIDGYFNLPYGTPIAEHEGVLYHDNRPICVARSFSSHEHFARNDDGQGQERGRLSHGIIKKLGGTHRPGEPTPEWDAIEDDEIANSYRRKDHETTWLWDDSFFKAPIKDLQYIAVKIGLLKGEKTECTK